MFDLGFFKCGICASDSTTTQPNSFFITTSPLNPLFLFLLSIIMDSPCLSDRTASTLNITGKRKRSRFSSTPEPTLYNQNVMQNVAVKKQKACLNCRRSKLKCVVEEEHGGACIRCLSRSEECRFRSRTHDEEWQEITSNRLDMLARAVEELSYSMNLIMPHLNNLNLPSMQALPQAQPPQQCAPMQRPPARIPTTASYTPMLKETSVMQPWLSPPTSLNESFFSHSFHSYSTPTGDATSVYDDNGLPFSRFSCGPPIDLHVNNIPQRFAGGPSLVDYDDTIRAYQRNI